MKTRRAHAAGFFYPHSDQCIAVRVHCLPRRPQPVHRNLQPQRRRPVPRQSCGLSAEIAHWPQMNDDERLRLMESCCRCAKPPAVAIEHPRLKPLPSALGRIQIALHPWMRRRADRVWNMDELAGLVPWDQVVPAAVLIGLVPRPSRPAGAPDPPQRGAAAPRRSGQFSRRANRSGDADACAAALLKPWRRSV